MLRIEALKGYTTEELQCELAKRTAAKLNLLAVGRGFIGTAFARDSRVTLVPHSQAFEDDLDISRYDAIINCAGIVGDSKCQKDDFQAVFTANSILPRRLHLHAVKHGIKFFQLSTTGMYFPQSCPNLKTFTKPNETSPTQGYNAYVISKLQAEEILLNANETPRPYILRVPLIKGQLQARVKNWRYCQDTYLSLISTPKLIEIVFSILAKKPPGGLYNVAEEIIYLPDFIARLGTKLPVRTEVSETMTSAVPICTQKAEVQGIL